MTRPSVKQAFAWHFSISLVIFFILITVMIKIWFPGNLFYMDGGWQGLKIIAPIDLILGPALTLLFYRPWKKSLKLDMSMIATVQILALGFGVYTVYHQRTAAIVFSESRFETISYNELKVANKDMIERDMPVKPLQEFGRMPVVVYATPYGKDDYGQYLNEIINGAPELRERSGRYNALSPATRGEIARWIVKDDKATEIEVPASSKAPLAEQAPQITDEIYHLKGRFMSGTIKFDGESYRIERNGSLFAGY